MVRRYWAGRDPLGGRFQIGGGSRNQRPWVTVVGVVRNVRHNGITDVVKEKFYVPHTQWHKSVGLPVRGMTLVIRDGDNPATLVPAVSIPHVFEDVEREQVEFGVVPIENSTDGTVTHTLDRFLE